VWTLCCLCSTLLYAADVNYEKAVAEALKANRLADVNRLCKEWAKAEPGNERPRIILGQALLRVGMPDRAVEQFELAAEANPLSPAPRCEMGGLFLTQGKPDAAAKEFGEALRLDSTCVPAAIGRAQAKLQRNDAMGALADAKRALRANPDSAQVRAVVGDCLLALGKVEEAQAELRKAVESDPKSADALFSLAKAVEIAGREKEAQEHWQRFLEAEPTGERAEKARNGWVLLKTETLPPGCRRMPVWSPDGKRILFGYGTMRMIHLRDKRITELKPPDGARLFEPDWSPDGKRMVFRAQTADGMVIALYELRPGGTLEPTGGDVLAQAVQAKFAPGGPELLLSSPFGEWRQRVRAGGLVVLDTETGAARNVRWRHPGRPSRNRGAWAPDGRTIVFHAHRDAKDRALFAMPIDDPGNAIQLTDNGVGNMNPVVSPDGRTVAFYAEEENRPRVVRLVRLDGSAPSVAFALGQNPSWSPDGRKLAYDGPASIIVAHLGGLGSSPVRIAADQNGDDLAVTLTNETDKSVTADLRYELFDANSFRVGQGPLGQDTMELKLGDVVECKLNLAEAGAKGECVVKFVAVTTDGKRIIKLVDVSVL